MENKNWKNLSVIQTIKSNMGILAGLVILCVVLSFTTSSFATVTNLFNVVRQITINLFPVSYTHLTLPTTPYV